MAKQLQNMFKGGGSGGIPRGASFGMKLLGAAAAIGIGLQQSMYTGEQGGVIRNTCNIIEYCTF